MRRYLRLYILIISIIVVLTGCKNHEDKAQESSQLFSYTTDIGAWITYWDRDIDEEIFKLADQLKEIYYFAVYFKDDGSFVIPDSLIEKYEALDKDKYTNYISFVNDVEKADGSAVMKDSKLIMDITGNKENRDKVINNMVNLALKYGFNGIEIDFEGIGKNLDLWGEYNLFINELYETEKENNLKLRVVLEPSIPVEDIQFCQGPVYSVMCYNLHGGFSGPGGKADKTFISDVIKKMQDIPGELRFAVATGGFMWREDGEVKAINEYEGLDNAEIYDSEIKRDEDSQCLYYSFEDENNLKNEVWYGDVHTLNSWIKIIDENGYKADLWRLGHNLLK